MLYELSKGETPFSATPPIRMYQKIINNHISMPSFFSSALKVKFQANYINNNDKKKNNNQKTPPLTKT